MYGLHFAHASSTPERCGMRATLETAALREFMDLTASVGGIIRDDVPQGSGAVDAEVLRRIDIYVWSLES
jgi:hypothetical protein